MIMSYNFNHLEYDKKWYGGIYDKFFSQNLDKINLDEKNTKYIVDKYLKLTSSHSRTKINPLVFSSGSGPFLVDIENNIYLCQKTKPCAVQKVLEFLIYY